MKRKKKSINIISQKNKRVKVDQETSSKCDLTNIGMSLNTSKTCTDLATEMQVVKQKKSTTCMKHKKRDKHILDDNLKKTNKKLRRATCRRNPGVTHVKRLDPHKTVVPQTLGDVSMNWRQMLQKLKAEKKLKQNKDHSRHKKKCKEKKGTRSKISEIQEPKIDPDIWFDDVDDILLERQKDSTVHTPRSNCLLKENAFKGLTHAIALDCEMVGVGNYGEDSIIARVSMVNHFGHCVYDKYVKPTEKVTDYRTFVSGIRPNDIAEGSSAEQFRDVQKEVSDILNGRLLVGHAVDNDLKVLFLDHPKKQIRDTSRWKYFRGLNFGRTPSLRNLADQVLSIKVQDGEHCSVQDAQVAMRLYTMHRKQWERDIKTTEHNKKHEREPHSKKHEKEEN